jgi:DNA-binding transcriptional regulator YiaG
MAHLVANDHKEEQNMEAPMKPDEVRDARQRLGMTLHQLALALRMGTDGRRAVRRWEAGDRQISGPASVAIEALLAGWRPAHLAIQEGE